MYQKHENLTEEQLIEEILSPYIRSQGRIHHSDTLDAIRDVMNMDSLFNDDKIYAINYILDVTY